VTGGPPERSWKGVMMDVNKVKGPGGAFGYDVNSVSAGGVNAGGGSFREQLGNQLKDDYKRRINVLLDELASLPDDLLFRADINVFEKFLVQIRDLLNEIVKNAYSLNLENVKDVSGRQRIFSSVHVIDRKLDELARELLSQNSGRLEFLSRVDEIRGLVTDMLL
jgi:uncharacterized protein YaaR (DUF327 family)